MPRYKITDSNTGKQIIVSGDSPPTEDEINQIIGSVNVGEKKGQKETPIEDVPKNAWKDLKDNAQGIIEGTKYVPGLQAMSMILTGENPYSPQNVMAQGKALASTPGALIDRAKELGAGELLTGHPINAAEKAYEAFKEKPISTAMDLYSAGELGIGASKLGAKAGAEIASKTVEKAIPWAAKKAVRVTLGPTERSEERRVGKECRL